MRTAEVVRNTKETQIRVKVDLDGTGASKLATGLPFLEHMLDQVARHGMVDLEIEAKGDLHIDAHHTVEDTAICLGQALREALGDKVGITRYGDALVPLDEAIAQAVVDVSGRPYFVHTGEPDRQITAIIGGQYSGSLTGHVLESIAHHAGVTMHVRLIDGRDPHHIAEAQFKAVARALRQAIALDPRETGIPSTKGAL